MHASARTNAQTISYQFTGGFAGSNVLVNGNTRLAAGYPTTATANISNLPIEKILKPFTNIPGRGTLSGNANLSGPIRNPKGSGDFTLTRASLYDEPIDRAHLQATVLPQSIDIRELQIVAGPSQIQASLRYDHPAGNFQRGTASFDIRRSRIDLARIHNIQRLRPGLGGILQIAAQGAGTVAPGPQPLSIDRLNANIAATAITADRKIWAT